MRFKIPTLEQVQARAAEIQLPAREAEKFYNYFDSKGWKVGKSPMQRWKSALANWKLNWEERSGPNGATRRFQPPPGRHVLDQYIPPPNHDL